MHQLQPQRPEELGVMVREVALRGVEQFLLRIARELRPALAVSDPSVSVPDRDHAPPVYAVHLHLVLRPAENIRVSDPGFHVGHNARCALSIRFQIVADRSSR
jgi:hypothetical protein